MTRKQTVAQTNAQAKLALNTGLAQSLVAVAQSVQIVVQATQYRAGLQALVETLQADQSIRHQDVALLLEVLDRHGGDMSQHVRDEYYQAILQLLSVAGLRDRLPAPPV